MSDKSANALLEYRGFKIVRTSGRQGFKIEPTNGPLPKQFRGFWTRQEACKFEIDAYCNDPARKQAKSAAAERSARAKGNTKGATKAAQNVKEDATDAESSSE